MKWGGGGSRISVFVHTQGIKTVHAGGRGSKSCKILSTQLLNVPLYYIPAFPCGLQGHQAISKVIHTVMPYCDIFFQYLDFWHYINTVPFNYSKLSGSFQETETIQQYPISLCTLLALIKWNIPAHCNLFTNISRNIQKIYLKVFFLDMFSLYFFIPILDLKMSLF